MTMATAAAAALLDELMGRCRNVGPDENVSETKWSDEDVRKVFLFVCEHVLFHLPLNYPCVPILKTI